MTFCKRLDGRRCRSRVKECGERQIETIRKDIISLGKTDWNSTNLKNTRVERGITLSGGRRGNVSKKTVSFKRDLFNLSVPSEINSDNIIPSLRLE